MIRSIVKTGLNFLKGKYAIVGVPAIIRNNKGEILLAKRSKNMLCYPLYWGLPGGIVEWGEFLEEAVKREVKEEIGVDVEIIKQVKKPCEELPNKNCKVHGVGFGFYCKIIKGIPKPKDETSEIKWFKPEEIRRIKLAYTHKQMLEDEKLI